MKYNKRIEFGEVRIGGTARRNLMEACNENWVSAGRKVSEFERKFAELFGEKYCSATASGTLADVCACLMLYDLVGAKAGDEIICPALAFVAVGNSIRLSNLRPVFCDVNFDLNIDCDIIEKLITTKTKAILSVNTMGTPCDMVRLREICDKHKLILISDSCESHGCIYNSHFVGAFADITTYSFYIAHLINMSEGGCITTSRKDIFDLIKSVKSHGRDPDSLYFDHKRFAINGKCNDLAACIGLEGIDTFWDVYQARKKTYYMFWEVCEPYVENNKIYINSEDRNCDNAPHGFSITLAKPDPKMFKIMTDALDDYNIHWKRNFGSMPTQHKAFEYLGYKLGDFPRAEHIGLYGLHVGLHQHLSKDDIYRMIECFNEVLPLI